MFLQTIRSLLGNAPFGTITQANLDAAANTASTHPSMTISVQNFAGTTLTYIVPISETVGDLKRKIYTDKLVECPYEGKLAACPNELQHLFFVDTATSLQVMLNNDKEKLTSYGVHSGTNLHAVVVMYPFGQYIHTIGSKNRLFNSTRGMCMSLDGKLLFVADIMDNCVKVIRVSDDALVKNIGSPGIEPGQFALPTFVCISHDGETLFVADSGNHRIQLFSVDGTHIKIMDGFNHPCGICLSPDDNYLYVANRFDHCIIKINMLDDTREQLIGIPESPGTGSNQLNEPFGLCISNDGDLLYVADSKNKRIQVFKTSNGSYMNTIGSAVNFHIPFDVQFSSDNDCLLVSDMDNVKSISNHDIKIIALNGNGNNQYIKPMCICLSPDHNLLYISDTNKVKVFSTYMTGGRRKSTSSKRKTLRKRRNIKRHTLRMKRNRRTRQTRK